MKNEQPIRDLVNALGVTAEVTLVFYRDVQKAGAKPDEALKVTQAFIAAFLYGNTGSKSES